ncbi:hypothetical protein ACW73L_01975 [Methylolobus aquaticus]
MAERPAQPTKRRRRGRELGQIVSQTPGLADFVARCQIHAAIEQAVRSSIPERLAKHCVHCVSHHDHLVVFADAAIHATALRFALAPALPTLNHRFESRWRHVQIRVFPAWQIDRRLRDLALPTRAIAEQVETAARYSPSDEIQAALARLAKTLRDPERR